MPLTFTEVEKQARMLPASERAQLAEVLLETLPNISFDSQAEWQYEIEERVAAYDRGESKIHPAHEVFTEANRLTTK